MRDRAQIVVIGAGIMGLSVAYHLAHDHGLSDVVVVDRSYLCGGASGRNGGGVRAQWSTEANIDLMRESIELCSEFARRMKINVWFRQGGYLFLVRTSAQQRMLEASAELQNEHGLRTRMLSPREALGIVPELDLSGVVAASFNPDDGVVFPWPFLWGYAEAAKKLGVDIAPFTDVVGFATEGSKIRGVVTNRGTIRTSRVVNAAGAWSPVVARMLGVELPNQPRRHEICSTEPLKPWLGPLVADLSNGLYFSQSTRGEIVGGVSNDAVPFGIDQSSSIDFLARYARAIATVCPVLTRVKVLRQWAGCYDVTPDANPIVGQVDGVEDFFQVSGFMGHGFMMGPVIGKRLAEHLANGTPFPEFDRWRLGRFRDGELLAESMIIG